ncbi:MAG: 4Fe-4S dicluster domain-containing protein [Oscillospiraceae bacterium]|nr:4Fe-4S dicluster domain-containing protein [Oscillospiraceae bacterium]
MNKDCAVPCRGCGSCTLNCPSGLDIPFLMEAYNLYRRTGERSGELYASLARNPKLCLQCAHCAELCPESINIPGTVRLLSVL